MVSRVFAIHGLALPLENGFYEGAQNCGYGQTRRNFASGSLGFGTREHFCPPLSRALKLVIDLVLATVILVILAPILASIALLIRLDGGPALFRHNRLGENNRLFSCFKFRSMRVDAEAELHQILANNPEAATEWTATKKLRDDRRVTPIGRFLRKSSADELPQLINVLRREMSLVGPRPIVSSERQFYGHDIRYYDQTKPGMTGLWQVSGRSNTSYAHRVELDIRYVRTWSLWQDFVILVRTVPAVLARRGAV